MANLLRHRALHRRWHRDQSKSQILRSQLGFEYDQSSRPLVCRGCLHYHGKAYGHSERRTLLICGFHPYGWSGLACPDWQGNQLQGKAVKP